MRVKFRKNSIGARMLFGNGDCFAAANRPFIGSIMGSGAIDKLSENSYDIFNQKIITRKNYLEYEMISRWSNLTEIEQKVQAHFSSVLAENNAGFEDIETNSGSGGRAAEKQLRRRDRAFCGATALQGRFLS